MGGGRKGTGSLGEGSVVGSVGALVVLRTETQPKTGLRTQVALTRMVEGRDVGIVVAPRGQATAPDAPGGWRLAVRGGGVAPLAQATAPDEPRWWWGGERWRLAARGGGGVAPRALLRRLG